MILTSEVSWIPWTWLTGKIMNSARNKQAGLRFSSCPRLLIFWWSNRVQPKEGTQRRFPGFRNIRFLLLGMFKTRVGGLRCAETPFHWKAEVSSSERDHQRSSDRKYRKDTYHPLWYPIARTTFLHTLHVVAKCWKSPFFANLWTEKGGIDKGFCSTSAGLLLLLNLTWPGGMPYCVDADPPNVQQSMGLTW